MNANRAQMSSNGCPANSSRMPQLMKKANVTNTAMAKANFIALIV